MVDTRTTTSACQFQKPIGVVATNEDAAAEMEQSKTRNHRARHKTRASLLSDKGLDAANHNPRFRRREKNVLDIPSYRTRASLLYDKGLDAANHNPRFRRREKNVLDIPSYRTGDYTHDLAHSLRPPRTSRPTHAL